MKNSTKIIYNQAVRHLLAEFKSQPIKRKDILAFFKKHENLYGNNKSLATYIMVEGKQVSYGNYVPVPVKEEQPIQQYKKDPVVLATVLSKVIRDEDQSSFHDEYCFYDDFDDISGIKKSILG